MVSYFTAGTAVGRRQGQPPARDPADACGLPIAVQKATTQADDIAARSRHARTAARRPSSCTPTPARTRPPPRSSRARTTPFLADSPIAAYAIKSTQGKLQAARRHLRLGAVRLRRAEEADRLRPGHRRRAEEAPDASGSYKHTLDKWGSDSGAISTLRGQRRASALSPDLGLAVVRGRSMEPTLHDGDRLLVQYAAPPAAGPAGRRTAAARADGAPRPVAVKRLSHPQRRRLVGRAGQPGRGRRLLAGRARSRRPTSLAVVLGRVWPRPSLLRRVLTTAA